MRKVSGNSTPIIMYVDARERVRDVTIEGKQEGSNSTISNYISLSVPVFKHYKHYA